MDSIQTMDATADPNDQENSSMSSNGSNCFARCIVDVKKCVAGTQICAGIILILLEIANYTTSLCPYSRSFVPGIWIGIIVVATGISNFMHFRVEYIQNKRLPANATPISYGCLFRRVYLMLSSLTVILCLSMIAFLSWFLYDLGDIAEKGQDPKNYDVKKSTFAMTVAMTCLYCVVLIATVFGVVYVVFFCKILTTKSDQRNETMLQSHNNTPTVSGQGLAGN